MIHKSFALISLCMTRAAVLMLAAATAVWGQQTPAAPLPPQVLIEKYCTACHNAKMSSGGTALDGIRAAHVAADAATWEKVLRKVRSGEMPPPQLARPSADASQAFVIWLERELDRSAAKRPNPGAPVIHRLNRAEYSNAVRDLLDLDMDHSASLPADDSGYGFDNIGDVLTTSPLLMEKYMSTARRVSRLAVGTITSKPSIEKYSATPALSSELRNLPPNLRGGIELKR